MYKDPIFALSIIEFVGTDQRYIYIYAFNQIFKMTVKILLHKNIT